MSTPHLDTLQNALAAARNAASPAEQSSPYRLPSLWVSGETGATTLEPLGWYAQRIDAIRHEEPQAARGDGVYNLFVRFAAAFDHDGDGAISSEPLPNGFRETGTLLKAIAMLPYIASLGAGTIYLLPLTQPGTANRKGPLGSPYASRNPWKLDPLLAEPALGLEPETLYGAFIEAAHRLGMRVVQEFVFRTAAVDSDWASQHPDWFYWLKEGSGTEGYAPPHFEQETLNAIYTLVDRHEMADLPAPAEAYRNRFARHPVKAERTEHGLVGTDADGIACRVASAFSDWPPDDRQPPWTDVTYLRMHTPDRFDYIAYNTVRMYDAALEEPETANTELWDEIAAIIPRWQERYDIDGAMMDMGHALPRRLKQRIVETARARRTDFLFWDENFDPTPAIRDEGFNAVFGSLPFVVQDIIYLRGLLNFLNKTGVALPFFGTGENHNTPRLCYAHPGQEAGRAHARFIFTLATVLPTIPFIHGGMELCEWKPVNLGLNFTDEDRARWPTESLPLFAPAAFDWENANGLEPLNAWIRRVLEVRARHLDLIMDGSPGTISIPWVSDERLFAIKRDAQGRSLLFVGNSHTAERVRGSLEFGFADAALTDLFTGRPLPVSDHRMELELDAGECVLVELPKQ